MKPSFFETPPQPPSATLKAVTETGHLMEVTLFFVYFLLKCEAPSVFSSFSYSLL